jgi:branched-chain amino acid transport system substrate-binding protein
MRQLARRWFCASIVVAAIGSVAPLAFAADQGVTDTTIKIGMHTSQTGPVAVFGLAYERAARLVFDKVNAAGGVNGRKIELIVEDDRGDAGAGVAAVTKLIDRDQVALIYGGPFTPVALAAFPKAIEKGIIYWSPAASTPLLTDPLKRLVFQAQMTLDDQAIPVAKLVASMKPKKIAFIRENNEYGTITRDATIAELKKHNLKIDIDEPIEPNALSATAQILKIKGEGADAIIYGGTPKPLAFVIREMTKQALGAPLVSFGGGSSAAIFELVTGEAPIEFYAVSPLACPLEDPCNAEFMQEWKQKYPKDAPIVWAAQGYASTQFFVEGLKQTGRQISTEKLITTFEQMPAFKTPIIPYPLKFTATNHRAIHGGYLDGFKGGKHYFFGDEKK